jgi:hypothetical protein
VSAQPALPGLENLTERQELALSFIRERGPVSNEEIGRHVREARGMRGEKYDVSNGKALALRLKELGLVRAVKGQRWVGTDLKPERPPEPEVGDCCGEWPFCGCAA